MAKNIRPYHTGRPPYLRCSGVYGGDEQRGFGVGRARKPPISSKPTD